MFISAQLQSINGVESANSFSEQPISGVKVVLFLNEIAVDSTQTTTGGTYHFDSVMIGIYGSHPLVIQSLNHSFCQMLPYLVVEKKKFKSHLEEHYQELEEFMGKPKKDRSMHNNEMAINSVRTIYVQDMSKLAGSLDDPIKSCWNVAWGY